MRVNDRLLLGVACGLLGNLPRLVIVTVAKAIRVSDANAFERAAGMFIDEAKVHTKAGFAVGVVADSVVAGMLGVVNVNLLATFGPRHAVLKGAFVGQGIWQLFYGALGSMGATKVRSVAPGTALAEFFAHSVYGASTAGLAMAVGDPSLFTSRPLISSPWSQHGEELHRTRLVANTTDALE